MNIRAALAMYAYGTSAGVLKEWETRPRSSYVYNPHARMMRLELVKPAGDAPILFENDEKTNWHWSEDRTHLIIESEDEDEENSSLGMGVKTVYSVPRENIAYWGDEEKSPRWHPGPGINLPMQTSPTWTPALQHK